MLPRSQPHRSWLSDLVRRGSRDPGTKLTPILETVPSPEDRIREALNSTRRWNREYKATTLDDAAFVASYLRKQLKRDAKIAVFIQRSIKKRVQPRLERAPVSLDEFCSDVAWQDVKAVVEDVLVRDTSAVMQLLRTP